MNQNGNSFTQNLIGRAGSATAKAFIAQSAVKDPELTFEACAVNAGFKPKLQIFGLQPKSAIANWQFLRKKIRPISGVHEIVLRRAFVVAITILIYTAISELRNQRE